MKSYEETFLENYELYRNNHEVSSYYSEITRNYTICQFQDCDLCVLHAVNCDMMNVSDRRIEILKEIYPEDFI